MKRRTSGSGGARDRREARAAGQRVLAASEFKAKCLRILDEVAAGQEVLVTKRGQEIARVIPVRRAVPGSSRGRWKGLVRIEGDIVHSDWTEDFDATR